MIVYRNSDEHYQPLKFTATKCKCPKFLSGFKGATWDFDTHIIDGVVHKMWVETSWGRYVYFLDRVVRVGSDRKRWYKFPMISPKSWYMQTNLDFGQESNVKFWTGR